MITHSQLGKQGRFGNQMFQIAAAIGCATANNDIAKFEPWPHNAAFKTGINQTLQPGEIEHHFKESGANFKPIPYQRGLAISGYFQSEKYFSHCADIIRDTFEFRSDLVKPELLAMAEGACSIHVRRTDYLALKNYHPAPTEVFFQRAIHSMRQMVNLSCFIVCSDDINWCKKNITAGIPVYFIEGNTPEQDMCLMSKCAHHIIANSSFSWWAAWLNPCSHKKVIYPHPWFGTDKRDGDWKDLVCPGWQGISY